MKDAIVFDLDGTLWDTVSAVVRLVERGAGPAPGGARPPDGGGHARLHGQDHGADRGIDAAGAALAGGATPHGRVHAERIRLPARPRRRPALRRPAPRAGGALRPIRPVHRQQLRQRLHRDLPRGARHGALLPRHACPGDTGLDKAGNIRKVLAEAGHPRAFYLGDTDGDERAARLGRHPFVHAAYGFGRAERPDAVLERVSDLPALAAELFSSPLFG